MPSDASDRELSLQDWKAESDAKYAAFDKAGLGYLCVNTEKFEFNCFHTAHPNEPCHKTYAQPGGGGCGCKENKQLLKRDENILVIKRHLPSWEQHRLEELLAAAVDS